MEAYQAKVDKLPGTNYKELSKQARLIFHAIEKRSKRKAYIRSDYFKKEKIFFDYFWDHLKEKSFRDRTRRLRYFPCALELVKKSRLAPISKVNIDRRSEILHRFTGITPTKEIFFVQVKEDRKTKKKDLLSVFPLD